MPKELSVELMSLAMKHEKSVTMAELLCNIPTPRQHAKVLKKKEIIQTKGTPSKPDLKTSSKKSTDVKMI
jgi:hypothetical protein